MSVKKPIKRKPPQRIIKTIPSRNAGYNPYDTASSANQARKVANSYPKYMKPKIVKTGKRGESYPYTIYVQDRG